MDFCIWYLPFRLKTALICIVLVLYLTNEVNGECKVDYCWVLHIDAEKYLGGQGQAQNAIECYARRTYLNCINKHKSKCHSDIKYHSILNVLTKLMKKNNCSKKGDIYVRSTNSNFLQGTTDSYSNNNANSKSSHCLYSGNEQRKLCLFFGDPHLKTFWNSYHTCRTLGTWPLIDNENLVVQVTNNFMSEGITEGSVLTKVTIIIKQNQSSRKFDCGPLGTHGMYQASYGYLPNTFTNGQDRLGKYDAVSLAVIRSHRHIRINIQYINTVIDVRTLNGVLMLSISMPEDVLSDKHRLQTYGEKNVQQRLQLCITGCPLAQQLSHRKLQFFSLKTNSNKKKITQQEAINYCKKRTKDFFFDTCVFDLLMSGNTSFAQFSIFALNDLRVYDSASFRSLSARTFLPYNYTVLIDTRSDSAATKASLVPFVASLLVSFVLSLPHL